MENKYYIIRSLCALGMVVAIITLPWWFVWVSAIILLFIFSDYYEIIAWGVLYDALYGIALPQFYNSPYIFSGVGCILFLIAYYLRRQLLVYGTHI